jgi:hypothetical protein
MRERRQAGEQTGNRAPDVLHFRDAQSEGEDQQGGNGRGCA